MKILDEVSEVSHPGKERASKIKAKSIIEKEELEVYKIIKYARMLHLHFLLILKC